MVLEFKLAICGSCVTRDIFRIAKYEKQLDYFARSSIISLMSEPLAIEHEDIKLDSNFQKEMVLRDCKKTLIHEVKNQYESSQPIDLLIIDLIDERFDLLRHKNSYITLSNESVNGKVEDLYSFEKIKRFKKTTHKLWESSTIKFFDYLLECISPDKIIIHESYWSSLYLDGNKRVEFPNQRNIEMNNEVLRSYYGFIRENYPQLAVVSAPAISSKNHVWGLSPVHYTDEYYLNIFNQLKNYGI